MMIKLQPTYIVDDLPPDYMWKHEIRINQAGKTIHIWSGDAGYKVAITTYDMIKGKNPIDEIWHQYTTDKIQQTRFAQLRDW